MAACAFHVVCSVYLAMLVKILFKSLTLTGLNKLNEKVKPHSFSSVYLTCALALESYKDVYAGKQPTIDTALNQNQKKRIMQKIKCHHWMCHKKKIPFQGHNDSDSSESHNKGNFKSTEPRKINCYKNVLQKVQRMHNTQVLEFKIC